MQRGKNLDRSFFRFVKIHTFGGQTSFLSLGRVCIPCSAPRGKKITIFVKDKKKILRLDAVALVCCSRVKWNVVPALIHTGGIVICGHAAVQSAPSVSRVDDHRWWISWVAAVLPRSHCILRQ